jgi:hypothetical protein
MIFTPATGEELYAELEGTFHAVRQLGPPSVYGEISITPRSYYNFFRRFEASGKLKFVGPWDNPELDIVATYEGYRQAYPGGLTEAQATDENVKKVDQKVIVEIKITGTRYEPKSDIGMKVELEPGKDPVDWATQAKGGDVQSDALSFIITGKFRDDVSASERQNLAADLGSAGVSSVTSSVLSGMLTDFVRGEMPFIRSAELSYSGGGTFQESADLRLSGEVFEGYFRFGGKLLSGLNNANVSYQLSVGKILNLQNIRDLYIELERKVEGSEATEDRKYTNDARLYYRISF